MQTLTILALLMLLVFGLMGLSLPSSIELARNQSLELTVCHAGPPKCDFAKIQEAIDAAPEGAAIRIGAGIYTEKLLIRDKSLRLIGVGQEKVFLKHLGKHPASLEIMATERPTQIWIEGLSLEGQEDPETTSFRGIGIAIEGWVQALLRRLTITDYSFGIFIVPGADKLLLSIFKPQVIIKEALISRNHHGISAASLTHTHIYRTTITENGIGILGGGFLLEQSTVTKNQMAGIKVSFSTYFPRSGQEKIETKYNLISENGVGVWLFAGVVPPLRPPEPKPGEVPPLAIILSNQIVANREYGISLQTARCLAIDERWQPESLPIQVEGWENEMRDNGKGDLCPADYPWPPGFRK